MRPIAHIRQNTPGVTARIPVRYLLPWPLALAGGFADNTPMATGRRDKKQLKNRPKYKQKRRLKDRRMKARKKAQHKRGLGRNKARRSKRGSKTAKKK
jgi:hypothetical protein